MIALVLGLLLQLASPAHAELRAGETTVQGWSQADMIGAFAAAGLTDIIDTTLDPNFPTITGRTVHGFPVQAVFATCTNRPPRPGDLCNGIEIGVAIPATENRWAEIIVGSLEPNVAGLNAMILPIMTANRPTGSAVSIGHYLVSDGGVAPQLVDEYLTLLLGVTEQTARFMLSDDPAHAELWQLEAQ